MVLIKSLENPPDIDTTPDIPRYKACRASCFTAESAEISRIERPPRDCHLRKYSGHLGMEQASSSSRLGPCWSSGWSSNFARDSTEQDIPESELIIWVTI